jgi:hypothetical protein
MTVTTPELLLRSSGNGWNYVRWEGLPADLFAGAPDTTISYAEANCIE